jgi:large subunit ribosomal protein L21
MLAIIRTGGKQYKVSPGDKIQVEKLEVEKGKEIVFDEVLLVEKNKKLQIGNPLVKEAKVIGKVLRQDKFDKVLIFKYKAKTRYRKKTGHRQPFTEVEITKIEA